MIFLKNSRTSNWVKVASVALLVVITLALVSQGVVAASACTKVNGKLTLNPDTTGSYKGDLKGNSTFSQTSFAFTDKPDTALLTGDNLIHTDDGDLMTQDAIVLRTTGAGEFAEIDTVVGGTGAWAGATGVIQATGKFTFASGGEGDYIGEICTP